MINKVLNQCQVCSPIEQWPNIDDYWDDFYENVESFIMYKSYEHASCLNHDNF